MPCIRTLIGVVFVCMVSLPLTADADGFDALTLRLPASTNAVMVIDGDGLLDSSIGKANQWRERRASGFAQRPSLFPPGATHAIIATELDIAHLTPIWEMSVFHLAEPIPLDAIRQRVGGVKDTLGATNAVRMPGGAYVVPFSNTEAAVYRGAQRQWTVQQVARALDRREPNVSPVIQKAIALVDGGNADLALGIVMQDAVSSQQVAAAVERSTALKEAGVDLLEAIEIINSVQGFYWTVDAEDRLNSEIRFDFSEDVATLRPVAGMLLKGVMTTAGGYLPEFDAWQAYADGKSIGMRGELSVEGLSRLWTLLDVDSSTVEHIEAGPAAQPPPAAGPSALQRTATRQYARRVNAFVEGLANSSSSGDLWQQLLWTDRAARQISRLSTNQVDEQVLQIGHQIAADLADIVTMFHYASDRASQRLSALPPPRVTVREGGIPTGRITTPFGRYYQYAPFGFAQIEMDGTPQMQFQAITNEEMTAANSEARTKFQEIQANAARMMQLAP